MNTRDICRTLETCGSKFGLRDYGKERRLNENLGKKTTKALVGKPWTHGVTRVLMQRNSDP